MRDPETVFCFRNTQVNVERLMSDGGRWTATASRPRIQLAFRRVEMEHQRLTYARRTMQSTGCM